MFKLFGSEQGTFKEVFDTFYKNIMSDKSLSHFFRNSYHVMEVLGKQTIHFASIHKLTSKELRDIHIKLGRSHAKRKITFASMESALSFLYKQFLRIFRKSPDDVIALDNFFTFISNSIAQGYLEHEIEQFTEKLRTLNSFSVNTDYLKDHLEWFLMLHSLIMGKDKATIHAFMEMKPTLSNVDIKNDALRFEIFKTDDKFQSLQENMLFSIEQHDFKGALSTYVSLREAFFSMTYLMSLAEQSSLTASFLKDPLTGAMTRKQMKSIMDKASAEAMISGAPFSVVLADIDHFKSVNDTYGHKAGDIVLKEFSSILERNKVKDNASLIRYGGEEFLMIFPNLDAEKTAKIMNDIKDIIEMTPFNIGTEMIHITSSFGVYEELPISRQMADPLDIIKNADEKLYMAKEQGRNRVVV